MLLLYHMLGFLAGFVIDLIVGDPRWFPHPVKFMGKLIAALEKRWNSPEKTAAQQVRSGTYMVVVVLLVTVAITTAIVVVSYLINVWVGVVVEALLTAMVLSTKDLRKESMRVYDCLESGDLEASRTAVSWIVGRDVNVLDEVGVAKAAVETVAENTADGVIGPMLYTAIGGPILGMTFKAINTMDSMVGYHSERYINFGRRAAKFDDAAGFLPSRLSAVLMIAATWILSVFKRNDVFDASRAYKIFRRDRFQHMSPNSAQTESVCAGALGIQLAGPISFFGKMNEKPFIGDDSRPVEYEDIRRANQLLYVTAFLCEIACLLVMGIIALVIL